jgi:hypothetical protein
MSQLIVPKTPDFEIKLHNFMNLRGISTETEAIIIAVKESLERAMPTVAQLDTTFSLEIILEQVAIEKKRLTSIYQDKIFLAIVPREDVNVIKQLVHAVKNPNEIKTFTLLDLANSLEQVIVQNTSQMLCYQDQIFLAVAPKENAEVVEKLEDYIDNANANDALKEKGSISLDEFKKELGL